MLVKGFITKLKLLLLTSLRSKTCNRLTNQNNGRLLQSEDNLNSLKKIRKFSDKSQVRALLKYVKR